MPSVMRRAPACLLLALLAVPATASAQAPTLDYSSATISRGEPLTFEVRTSAPAGSVVVRVPGGAEPDAEGLLIAPDGTWLDEPAMPVADGVQAWTVPRT